MTLSLFRAPTPDFAAEFVAMLDRFHSLPEIYDNELDAQIHEMQARSLRDRPLFPRKPYFSPSSASSCKRELYMKAIGAKRDVTGQQPHQGRWTRMGTAWGDVIQRDLLYIEKHWKRIFGEEPPFVPVRNDRGEPMWEDFAKRNAPVKHRGHSFYLFGKPDGLLRHTATGTIVGLELKTKQTTPARTSPTSMKVEDEKHRSQVVGYSIMYPGIVGGNFVVPYGNLAKKSWVMTDEEYAKNPDLRAFDVAVTVDMKREFLDYCADVLDAVDAKIPPKLDLTKWTFNNFKTACALSLTVDELYELTEQVERVKASKTLKPFEKQAYADALAEIMAIRGSEETKGAKGA